jgi:exonuclease III
MTTKITCKKGFKLCPKNTNYMGLCIRSTNGVERVTLGIRSTNGVERVTLGIRSTNGVERVTSGIRSTNGVERVTSGKNDDYIDCNSKYDENKAKIPIVEYNDEDLKKYEFGLTKGYKDDNLNKFCGDGKIYDEYNNDTSDEIPEKFSIITLNVMGIFRNNLDVLKLMKIRAKLLEHVILNKKPDILCFQEMSKEFFHFLYSDKIKKIYPWYHNINFIDTTNSEKYNDIETFVISKYQPKKISSIGLNGILGYYNSLLIIEYDNLIVFNMYCQAGSKSSPGQEFKALHYSRCRAQQFEYINEMIMNKYKNKPIILLGDLNFDLNGNQNDWPELNNLNKLNLNDSWKDINKNKNSFYGLTENTQINTMRYNSKFENKMYRYDAILYNDKLMAIKSKVICNKPLKLDYNHLKFNKYYENVILKKDSLSNPNLKIAGKYEKQNIYDLFISDHFGVLSEFNFK